METLKSPEQTKANKEHSCDFCFEKIVKGEVYVKSTHKYDGLVYDWKTHIHCSEIADRLKMYDYADEGVTSDHFQESIQREHDNLLIAMFPENEIQRYSDVIQQLRKVRFRDKLGYVIRYYKKLDIASKKENKITDK